MLRPDPNKYNMQAYLIDIFDSTNAAQELINIGVSNSGRIIMGDKLKFIVIKLKNINSTALNILKQEALSIGAELANHKDVITGKIAESDSILFGTPVQLRIIVKKIRTQEFGLKELSKDLENILTAADNKDAKILKTGKGDIIFSGKTYIMGILNVTPDSFSDGGDYFNKDAAVKRGLDLEREGADIIDIGGESTRPGAINVDEQVEIDRVCPVIEKLSKTINLPISIDTRKPGVAGEALKAGASIINDVSGLSYDKEGMAGVLAATGAPYILMHSRGKLPEDMQRDLRAYDDIFYDILTYFNEKVEYLEEKGYGRDNIIIDPGFGFAKSMVDNYNILSGITSFKSLGLPLLCGVSRKSFISAVTGKNKNDILSGNIAIASYMNLKRVDMVRVHDVKQTAKAFAALDKITN